jgi:hypothetical protein
LGIVEQRVAEDWKKMRSSNDGIGVKTNVSVTFRVVFGLDDPHPSVRVRANGERCVSVEESAWVPDTIQLKGEEEIYTANKKTAKPLQQ